jgi:hypothetical protein
MNELAKIIWPAGLLTKPAFIFGASLAFAFCGSPSAARAADAEAVTIGTTFTVRLEKPAPTARASVVLMADGSGVVSVDTTTGAVIGTTGDFLIRSANFFLRNGLNVMIANEAPAHLPGGLSIADRLSAVHAAELQGYINAALNRWGKPVWVVGTGFGSISAVTAGGFQPALAGLSGVVMTSPVTNPLGQAQPTFNLYVSRITLPALVAWHRDDLCGFSPPGGSAALFAAIPSIGKASAAFERGHSVADSPCDSFSGHGYAGIEEEVVEKIADFIRRREID